MSLDALARLLPGRLAPGSSLPGYWLRYHPGPLGSAGPGSGVYALTAVPEEATVTGVRGFCVDSTGAMRFTADASAPKMVAGLCDPGLPVVG